MCLYASSGDALLPKTLPIKSRRTRQVEDTTTTNLIRLFITIKIFPSPSLLYPIGRPEQVFGCSCRAQNGLNGLYTKTKYSTTAVTTKTTAAASRCMKPVRSTASLGQCAAKTRHDFRCRHPR